MDVSALIQSAAKFAAAIANKQLDPEACNGGGTDFASLLASARAMQSGNSTHSSSAQSGAGGVAALLAAAKRGSSSALETQASPLVNLLGSGAAHTPVNTAGMSSPLASLLGTSMGSSFGASSTSHDSRPAPSLSTLFGPRDAEPTTVAQAALAARMIADAQASQQAQQRQTLEMMQRLQNIQNLQRQLSEREQQKLEFSQHAENLKAQFAAQSSAGTSGTHTLPYSTRQSTPSTGTTAALATAAAVSRAAAAAGEFASRVQMHSPNSTTLPPIPQLNTLEQALEVGSHTKPRSAEEARQAAVHAVRMEAKMKNMAERDEVRSKIEEAERLKCHLHKKPKESCKFCKKHKDFVTTNGLEGGADAKRVQADANSANVGKEDSTTGQHIGPIEIANKKTYGFPSVVQAHILDARYYESTISLMQTFEDLVDEARTYVKSVEPYMPDSTTMPTPFLCIVYRLFAVELDSRQVRKLIERTDNPYLRCVGFVYLRFGLHPDKMWSWFGDYITDDEEFQPTAGAGEPWLTIGEFVESLLTKEKYYTTLLPRISSAVSRKLEERLAPVVQYRKRLRSNRDIIEVYSQQGTRVEVNIDGEWHNATTVDLIEHPSRPKVRVRLFGAGAGQDQLVDLGRVIVTDDVNRAQFKYRERESRGRSRSRSRDRTDWSRTKGKSNMELLEEMRQEARERAVCSSGKDYSRRPKTFEKGLANPREGQGVAARRLLEEETFIKVSDKKRSASPDLQLRLPKEQSAEHQERMRKLFEKYGNAKPAQAGSSSSVNSIEGPDLLRLG